MLDYEEHMKRKGEVVSQYKFLGETSRHLCGLLDGERNLTHLAAALEYKYSQLMTPQEHEAFEANLLGMENILYEVYARVDERSESVTKTKIIELAPNKRAR